MHSTEPAGEKKHRKKQKNRVLNVLACSTPASAVHPSCREEESAKFYYKRLDGTTVDSFFVSFINFNLKSYIKARGLTFFFVVHLECELTSSQKQTPFGTDTLLSSHIPPDRSSYELPSGWLPPHRRCRRRDGPRRRRFHPPR